MPFFYFDYYYLILVVPALIFAMYAQVKINSNYRKYSSVYARGGMTAAQVSEMILRQNGIFDVTVQRISGNLTDHYDPKRRVISLSEGVYSSTSIAAIGIAAHETGHALQHETGYFPIKIRMAIVPITNIGSMLGIPLAFIGLLISSDLLVNIGLLLFSLVAIFQLVTLPVEFNASGRALKILKSQAILASDELVGAKKVLSAAALTYVAAFLSSLANLLRLLLIFGNRRDDRDD